MKLIVNAHNIVIDKTPVNEREIDISKCEFEFADEITNDYVKEAYFTFKGVTYKQIIINNECAFPSEVLTEKGTVEIGVVAYKVEDEETIKRYNPSPAYFNTWDGSLKDNAENSEPITPSEMEQYEQALQDGLTEVNDKLDDIDQALTDVNTAITETNNLNLDVSKSGKVATVTLTKKDASTKVVTLSDGTNLMFNWDGTKLGIKTDEDEDYTYVDLQGIQGETGPMGAPFTIKKTYSSVTEMNADFNNMEVGDYVMITSTVETEDNAKLYCKGTEQWIFITDFSGATGIQGPTGATPNIQIGTVVSGANPSVTRTGTNENPVLNFTLVEGEKGDTGATGPTGNGIATITKTSTSGLVDTYTITYTNGNTTTFDVTNGEDGEVTQTQLDETNAEVERAMMVYNALPKVTDEDTDLTLNGTAYTPMELELNPSELTQETTTGANLQKFTPRTSTTYNKIYICDEKGQVTITGNASSYSVLGYNVYSTDPITLIAGTYKLKVIGTISSNTGFLLNGTTEITLDSNQEYTLELNNDTNNFYISIGVNSGQHNDNFYITLASGNTATTERYTGGIPSPNSEFPSEVQVIKGNNSIKIENKNLAWTGWAEDFVSRIPQSDWASITTYDGRNALKIYCATGYQNYDTQYIFKTNFKENTQYTFSFDLYATNANSFANMGIYYTDGTSLEISGTTNTWVHKTITTASGKTIKYVRGIYREGWSYIDLDTFMVEEGTTASTYVAHQEQVLPLNLPVENLFNKTTISNNKYVQSSDGELANLNGYIASDYIEVTPNTQYYWNDSVDRTNQGAFYNSSKTYISGISNRLFTTPSNAKYVRLTSESSLLDTLQLEKGNKANRYTPFGVTPIEYCKIGEYEDEFEHDDDKWYLNKYVRKVIINSDNISLITDFGTINSHNKVNISKINLGWKNSTDSGIALMTKYKEATTSATTNSGNFNSTYNASNIIIANDSFTDLTTARNLLIGNEIYIALATTTHTEITDTTLISQLNAIEKAVSYDGQTNISQTNAGLPFRIKASAVRSLANIFEAIE